MHHALQCGDGAAEVYSRSRGCRFPLLDSAPRSLHLHRPQSEVSNVRTAGGVQGVCEAQRVILQSVELNPQTDVGRL